MNQLEKSLQKAPIIKRENYNYVIHPLTDGIPYIKPELITEVTDAMANNLPDLDTIDTILTIEAMGIPLATKLSLDLGIPFTIIRKRKYGLPGEISVKQVTGYSKSKLFINGLKKGDRIVIVDDVLSTGGTLRAILSSFKKIGIITKGVFIAIDKGNCSQNIGKEFNVDIKTLVNITVDEEKLTIKG